jgi:hypothetical protein
MSHAVICWENSRHQRSIIHLKEKSSELWLALKSVSLAGKYIEVYTQY